MGRIKTVLIKRITKQLVSEHAEEFSEDFTKNKEVVTKYTNLRGSKMRNTIAGYVSRLIKQAREGKAKRYMAKEDISKFY